LENRIRVLDEDTVNKIAAGEVVERPASVVKELVENSLDAGATNITVSIEDGGKKLISVRDDGFGMSRADAEASFRRHATSKISSIEDLSRLSSYGFRGEALSSIAAVSRVILRTREPGSNEGVQIVSDSGKVTVSTVGCPVGTEVVVEELFGNLPARRKSLKSKNIELAHCREVVLNYILCRPGLSFTFISDDETDIVHVAAEGIKGSLATAFDSKVAEGMMFGDAEREGVRVESFVGRLEHSRSSLTDLRLFVNDRPVRNQKLASAVLEGYGSKLMKDRYPVGVIRIFVEGSLVDVNVHPSKREVKFAKEGEVLSAVGESIGKALETPSLLYQYDLTKFAERFEAREGVPSAESIKTVQATLKMPEVEAKELPRPLIVPLAQIMNTYILAESGGNLLLIDQHAASERIVYESVLKSIETGKELSQALLAPLVIRMSAAERRVFEEHRETLEGSGFVLEPFGKESYALRSIPTVLGVAQGESAFRNILGDLAKMAPGKKLGLEVIWRVACHTAVRAGEVLSEGQMRQLVSELMHTESPYTCEHGRPTMIVLSPADLERLFKRQV